MIRRSRAISFEDALELTSEHIIRVFSFKFCLLSRFSFSFVEFGKFNFSVILLTGIILNSVLMECLGISFVLPVAQCDLKLTTQDKGILSAVAFAGNFERQISQIEM